MAKSPRIVWNVAFFVLLPPVLSFSASIALADVGETIGELRGVVVALEHNAEERVRAWPTRHADQQNERNAPLAYRKLMQKADALRERRAVLLLRLAISLEVDSSRAFVSAGQRDLTPLLNVLDDDPSSPAAWSLVETLLPIAAKLGAREPRVANAMVRLASKLSPCPPALVAALSEVGTPVTSRFLFDLAAETRDLDLFSSAARGGSPWVVRRLISMADGKDPELARLGFGALTRVDLSAHSNGLSDLIRGRITAVDSKELAALLIGLLGQFRDASNLELLQSLYARPGHERIRAAAIGAIGNLGVSGARFLVGELENEKTPVEVKAIIADALGATEFRPAIPVLIDALTVSQLNRPAARALRRISGQRLGKRPGPWMRWWQRQSESRTTSSDPDEDLSRGRFGR